MTTRPLASVSSNINTHLTSTSAQDLLDIITAALQRLYHRSASAKIEQPDVDRPSAFLRLPPEMRMEIYETALLNDSDSDESNGSMDKAADLSLLQTCRQVNKEAQPLLHQRPKFFTSQPKLYAWIEQAERSHLERVTTLKLQLRDVKVSDYLEQGSKRTGVWDLYLEDLVMLDKALGSMPNLSSMEVMPPKWSGSHFLVEFYRRFLASLLSRCPKLSKLTLHDNRDILNYVPTLSKIRDLRFEGPIPQGADGGEPGGVDEQPWWEQWEQFSPSPGTSSRVNVDRMEKRRAYTSPPSPMNRLRAKTLRTTDQ